jgi:tetratricopeptide (TPR) repeat protein
VAKTTSVKFPRRRVAAASAIALVVLAAASYIQTLRFGLVWDDPKLLRQVVQTGETGGAAALFNTDFRLDAEKPLGYYRPLTTLSLWLQVSGLRGPDAIATAAGSLHRANVLIHVVCTLLVWMLVRRISGRGWAAFLGAALFAVHPIHVEAVAFISARTDLLASLFVLGSTLCWLDARTAKGVRRTLLLVVGAALALAGTLSKEQALLLPLLLMVWSFLFRKARSRWWRDNRGWLVAWIIAEGVALAMRANADAGLRAHAGGAGAAPFLAVLSVLLLYLRMWFVPWPLNTYYVIGDLALAWPVWVAAVATLALIALAVRGGRGREALAACVFAVVFLLPVLHLIPFYGAVAAERYLYLSSAGLALLTSLALVSLERVRVAALAGRLALGVAILAGVVLCYRGAPVWASDDTLFAHMIRVSPDAAVSHRGMAVMLERQGKYADAARECRRAIELDPGYVDAHELLGVVSARQGDVATARTAFETVARLQPERASPYINLGVLEFNEGDLEASARHLRRAAALQPASPDVHFYLGNVLAALGDVDGARREIAILDRLDPARARIIRQALAQPDEGQ